jgi:hypothetical protein
MTLEAWGRFCIFAALSEQENIRLYFQEIKNDMDNMLCFQDSFVYDSSMSSVASLLVLPPSIAFSLLLLTPGFRSGRRSIPAFFRKPEADPPTRAMHLMHHTPKTERWRRTVLLGPLQAHPTRMAMHRQPKGRRLHV